VRVRHVAVLILGLAACAAGAVAAQEAVNPPPPPGYIPGVGYAPPADQAPAAQRSVLAQADQAPPPEEGAPPSEASPETVAPAEPLPAPEAKKREPMKRRRFSSAILQAVDKTTAETLRFEAKVGEPVRYKGLVLTVHACELSAPDEGHTDAFAHVNIQAQPEALGRTPARVVFRGWMFANAPGLHPVQHPLYDVWLITCRTAAPEAAGLNL